MSSEAVRELAALIGLLIGIGTLAGLVWKMSSLATQLRLSIAHLEVKLASTEKMSERLGDIPLIEQRLGQLEKFVSTFPRQMREEREREREWEFRKSQGDFK